MNDANKNARDTQFQGFADAVCSKLEKTTSREEALLIMTRAAYDLVGHVIDHAPSSVSDADDWNIPDLTELPKDGTYDSR